jgi:4-amino-4-deoxychorismate lyase
MAAKNLINGKVFDQIEIFDRALHYGDGVFETIAIQDGKVLCFDEHLNRLEKGCKKIKIPVQDKTIIKNEILSLTENTDRAVVKIIITRGQGGRGYKIPDNIESTRIISLFPWPDYSSELSIFGIKTKLCNYRYSNNPVLAGIKHLNRLEQILARAEWGDKKIIEGIVMNSDNYIIEGTMSNIFCILEKTLYTPDLSLCGIEGIVREKIINLADNLKFKIEIKKITLDFLLNAEEIFMCNSLIGIWPINSIDEKLFLEHKETQKIRNKLIKCNFIPKS